MGNCGPCAEILLVPSPLHLQLHLAVVKEYIFSVLAAVSGVYRWLFVLLAFVEGLPCSSHHILPWWISWKVSILRLTVIRRYFKISLEVLGSSRHRLILAPRWWHFMRNICTGVEFYTGKTQHNLSLVLLLSWWHRCDGIDNVLSRDRDTNFLLHGMPICLSQLVFHGWWLLYQEGIDLWRRSWILHVVVHTRKFLGSCAIFGVSWAW